MAAMTHQNMRVTVKKMLKVSLKRLTQLQSTQKQEIAIHNYIPIHLTRSKFMRFLPLFIQKAFSKLSSHCIID